MTSKIDKLSKREGIIAVAGAPSNDFSKVETRGEEKWFSTLFATFHLLETTTEPSVRVVLGDYTIFVEVEDGGLIAVVISTGHRIAKSLRRTLRKYTVAKDVEGRVERAPELEAG